MTAMDVTVIEPRWVWDAEEGLRQGCFVLVGGGRVLDVVRERPTA